MVNIVGKITDLQTGNGVDGITVQLFLKPPVAANPTETTTVNGGNYQFTVDVNNSSRRYRIQPATNSRAYDPGSEQGVVKKGQTAPEVVPDIASFPLAARDTDQDIATVSLEIHDLLTAYLELLPALTTQFKNDPKGLVGQISGDLKTNFGKIGPP